MTVLTAEHTAVALAPFAVRESAAGAILGRRPRPMGLPAGLPAPPAPAGPHFPMRTSGALAVEGRPHRAAQAHGRGHGLSAWDRSNLTNSRTHTHRGTHARAHTRVYIS